MSNLRYEVLNPFLDKGVELSTLGKKMSYYNHDILQFFDSKALRTHYKDICGFFLSQIDIEDGHLETFEDLFDIGITDWFLEECSETDEPEESVVLEKFSDYFHDIHELVTIVEAQQGKTFSCLGQFSYSGEVLSVLTQLLGEFLNHSTNEKDEQVFNSIKQVLFSRYGENKALFQQEREKTAPPASSMTPPVINADKNALLEEALQELNALIGMEDVKKDIHDSINFIRIQQKRESHGLPTVPSSLHVVFTGKPGTGKTTIARLLARIYHAIGILSSNHTVETDRAGLVGEYIGHTAQKTDKKISEAMGGVLLIDEAYALTRDLGGKDFGLEAVDTLLKRMEDHRDKFAVVVTGYGEEIHQFIASNPGLKSRFTKYIHFEDYTPDELVEIFQKLCNDFKMVPTQEALHYLREYTTLLYENRDETFSNGRTIRTIFEKTMKKQSNRLIRDNKTRKEDLIELVKEDIDTNAIN